MKKLSYFLLSVITIGFIVSLAIFVGRGNKSESTILMDAALQDCSTFPTDSEITQNGKININTASAETLKLLNGIGDVLAERIVVYRENNGPFTDVNQLLEIKGIGEVKLSKIKEYIALN